MLLHEEKGLRGREGKGRAVARRCGARDGQAGSPRSCFCQELLSVGASCEEHTLQCLAVDKDSDRASPVLGGYEAKHRALPSLLTVVP